MVATNVAETSLTVPGIRYVVDAGTARISPLQPPDQGAAPADRTDLAGLGRSAGRTLRPSRARASASASTTSDDFERRPEFTDPEILRTNLASVILQMAAMELGDIESFPFLDPPDSRAIRDGVALLHELGAIDPDHEGTRAWLTPMGRRLSRLPLDPRLGRMVLAADENGCLSEMLVIAAALTIPDPRERPDGKETQAAQSHARFRDRALRLPVVAAPVGVRPGRTARADLATSSARCARNEYLNYRRVREWQDLHSQLRDIAKDMGLHMNRKPADPELLHRSLLTGLLSHIGRKDPDGYEYRGARGARFSIAPGSDPVQEGTRVGDGRRPGGDHPACGPGASPRCRPPGSRRSAPT